MEVEQLEPRVKALSYKVKAISRESPAQKASNLLDSDLRTHWSTATNTKEWILLELDEPCLLSHIRIYNKSVLEWEIAAGLRYKPETFVKVRPRCEAPRREMVYLMNYTPCRYVRISCLRGNPIAIFFIQLIGITVTGLEADFQQVVNHLLPQIISHKQDTHDLQLQLLQDMTERLHPFIPQLEDDLASFSDAADSNLRFLAMLAGPFYPLLRIVKEREVVRSSGNILDSEASRTQPSSSLTVSSNFEPRRMRNTSLVTSTSSPLVFRPDLVFVLLRKAYKDPELGTVCRMTSSVLNKLIGPITVLDAVNPSSKAPSVLEEPKLISPTTASLVDYSELFGAEFLIPDDQWDVSCVNLLDLGAVEEGLLHVLYGCASQPQLCSKLAESTADLWSALPLVQALLPALRPLGSSSDHVDDNFSHWKQPYVQKALSQIVSASSSSVYRQLLHACAGYLSSYSPSHAKAACVLIDLCSSVLAPWMAQVIAKVDLAVELVEDFLGIIQGARQSLARSCAALKCIVMALSGHMDDMLGKYKEVKHKILFLIEMLEPFLHPMITTFKSTVTCEGGSSTFEGKQEHASVITLNIIRTAIGKPAVLPSLEAEWRSGSVAPSVILSIIEPHMQLPPEVDSCKCSVSESPEHDTSNVSLSRQEGTLSKSNNQDESDGKTYSADVAARMDVFEDVSLFFAPPELQRISLTNIPYGYMPTKSASNHKNICSEMHVLQGSFSNICLDGLVFDAGIAAEWSNLQADYFQLTNHPECELRASEFQRLAMNLNSQQDITVEAHDAAVEALLLAAECYVNPSFMLSLRGSQKDVNEFRTDGDKSLQTDGISDLRNVYGKSNNDVEKLGKIEEGRDRIVLQLLLEAAELDREYYKKVSSGENHPYVNESFGEQAIKLSPQDMHTADAVTLVRRNQALLCTFLIHRLQREKQSMHEILIQTLVFLLHTATKLYCAPEHVIGIILQSSEYLNETLTAFYHQLKGGSLQLDPNEFHGVQRRWILLQKLVIASSGGDYGSYFTINSNSGCSFGTLIKPSAWLKNISSFSTSAFPLVRFLGWMAISRNAKQYTKDQLFLASDLSQLTSLLSIFSDELAVVENISYQKHANVKNDRSCTKEDSTISKGLDFSDSQGMSFHVIHPDLSRFFPNMKIQFAAFGEAILEAVGLQLRSLSSSAVLDVLCWFSDLCSWPFSRISYKASGESIDHLKGYEAKNAKAIILYILEAIVIEHMETLVPEMPRVVQVLESLCKAPFCDVSFLGAVLHLLKPLISYSLCKVSNEERFFVDDSCLSFESLCFDELFINISEKSENRNNSEKEYSRALMIYILGTVFLYLSSRRKHELLQSLVLWADFATFEPTSSFHDYLCAFQCVMESCKTLLVHNLKVLGLIPQPPHSSNINSTTVSYIIPRSHSRFLDDVFKYSERSDNDNVKSADLLRNTYSLSIEEIEEISRDLEVFISKLNPTLELCWTFHHQLANKLTITAAECVVLMRCLCTHVQEVQNAEECEGEMALAVKLVEKTPDYWRTGLERLAENIITVQENHCWQVASVMLSCLLGTPPCFCLDNVNGVICSVIKTFSCSAPKIAWRLLTDKWLSLLCERGGINDNEVPVIDLFCTLLGHSEPEQRFIALHNLGKLVGQDVKGEIELYSSRFCNKLASPVVVSERMLSLILTNTWDPLVLLASSDVSFPLKVCAMALLVGFIPFAERRQLQSFLSATDNVLRGLGSLAQPTCDGPLVRLSLALLAGACLYCPAEDINLIPQNVWREIQNIGLSGTEGGRHGDLEKKACQVLCKLKNEGEVAKVELEEVLSSCPAKQYDPDFACTRESILQVLTNLSSVQSYFDIFLDKTGQEILEQEEAEMELDIAQKEHALQESSQDSKDRCQTPSPTVSLKDNNRLQQIKDQIRSLEKAKLRQDIITRRQKKLLTQRSRQKYLEEAALREAELLQELDRERTAQAEREIERQRLLELERAKTRELRYNLDMEKEKQTQRELQRDLEQAETGIRSRRDISSSTHSGRQRERYRERDSGRPSNEGNARAGSGILLVETSASSSMTTMPTILSGSRTFSGHVPTILQSRERLDECGSSYEENFDGSRDSGDTSSIGDPDMMSAFDGQTGGVVSTSRHGSRGSKSRQVMDRRERDSRREGKWERKH